MELTTSWHSTMQHTSQLQHQTTPKTHLSTHNYSTHSTSPLAPLHLTTPRSNMHALAYIASIIYAYTTHAFLIKSSHRYLSPRSLVEGRIKHCDSKTSTFLSAHANRHAGDISFTVCLSVRPSATAKSTANKKCAATPMWHLYFFNNSHRHHPVFIIVGTENKLKKFDKRFEITHPN